MTPSIRIRLDARTHAAAEFRLFCKIRALMPESEPAIEWKSLAVSLQCRKGRSAALAGLGRRVSFPPIQRHSEGSQQKIDRHDERERRKGRKPTQRLSLAEG